MSLYCLKEKTSFQLELNGLQLLVLGLSRLLPFCTPLFLLDLDVMVTVIRCDVFPPGRKANVYCSHYQSLHCLYYEPAASGSGQHKDC